MSPLLDCLNGTSWLKIVVLCCAAYSCVTHLFGETSCQTRLLQQESQLRSDTLHSAIPSKVARNPSPSEESHTPTASMSPKTPAMKWFASLAGEDNTECNHVRDMVKKGEWEDPNNGQLMSRRVDTEPHFFVSVHNFAYDHVRYKSIFQEGNYYEVLVRSRFEHILSENMNSFDYSQPKLPLVLDIGGNIGYYTLLSAAWKHAVMTFEVNPANIIRICESLHLNDPSAHGVSDLSHPMAVKVFQRGASNSTGSTFAMKVGGNPGEVGLDNKSTKQLGNDPNHIARKSTERFFTVTTVTLDDLASEKGWFDRDDVSFSILKIDTEGHEKQIVEGAPKFLKAHFAKNILIEYRPHCLESVKNIAYSGYVIVDDKDGDKRMQSKEETLLTLENVTEAMRRTRGYNYEDFWFRLESLPL